MIDFLHFNLVCFILRVKRNLANVAKSRACFLLKHQIRYFEAVFWLSKWYS